MTPHNRHGYKVIHKARVHEVRDVEEAAKHIAGFYPDACKVRACESLTHDRPVNPDEFQAIINRATELIVKG